MTATGTNRRRRAALCLLLACTLAGCVRGCKSRRPPLHVNPNMDLQPRHETQAASDFFYDGAAMRIPVAGTVARGELRDESPYFTGRDAEGKLVARAPVVVDDRLLERGRDRYRIYCQPCHDPAGRGKGILYQRGNVPMPDFRDERLVGSPDGHFFDVITHGLGLMSPYAYPVKVEDRWAIVAHIRVLQGDVQQ